MIVIRILALTSFAMLASLVPGGTEADWDAFTKRVCLKSPADVEHAVLNAANSERAVIYVHVEWNFDMYFRGTTFLEFADRYQQRASSPAVGFHYIDCTSVTDGYAPLEKLSGWLERTRMHGGSLIHGMGELIWLEHGHVLKVTNVGLDTDPDDLVAEALATWSDGT